MPEGPDGVTANRIAQELGLANGVISYWVKQGWVTVLQHPERHGQKMVLDRASVEACFRERKKKDPRHSKKGRRTPIPTRPHPHPHQTPSSRYTSTSPSIETAESSCMDLAQQHIAEYDDPDKSPGTLRNKRRVLLPFAQAVPTLPCTRAQVDQFIKGLVLGQNTRNLFFRQVRTFLYWAQEVHHLPAPSLRRLAPRVLLEDPDPLTAAEAQRFLAAAVDGYQRLMFEYMLMTGCRAGGVYNLRRGDVHPDHVEVLEKTGKVRYRITPEMAQRLLALRRDPVFLDNRGHPITKDGVSARVHNGLRRAGIVKKKMGAHILRHTAGTMIYEQSGDLKAVQAHLGHKTLHMANRYATLTEQRRQLSFDEYNPLAYVKNGGKA